MSYILAALKKAESERREQSDGVGVRPMLEPALVDERSLWPALFLIGVVIALVGLMLWLWAIDLAGPKVLVAAKPPSAMTALPSSARPVELTGSREIESTRVAIAPGQQALSAKKNVFDSVDIKGHLYVATRPSLRKVVINESTLREGEKINGILVKEITETGVILDFKGLEKTIWAY